MSLTPPDDDYVSGPFGLSNYGNNCYANAIIQALVSCPTVVKTVLENNDYMKKTPVGQALYDFMHAAYHRNAAAEPRPSAPYTSVDGAATALKQTLAKHIPKFDNNSQQCAGEMFEALLNATDVDTSLVRNGAQKTNPLTFLFYHRIATTNYCSTCKTKTTVTGSVHETIRRMFYYDRLKNKPKTPKEFCEILRCEYSRLEGYRCDKCDEKTRDGLRVDIMEMIPEILVCMFNGYDDQRTNLTNKAQRYYPAELYFAGKNNTLLVYRLYSQVEHSGGNKGGHYTASAIRAFDGVEKVYWLNDSTATQIVKFVRAPNVFMLFYVYYKTVYP